MTVFVVVTATVDGQDLVQEVAITVTEPEGGGGPILPFVLGVPGSEPG